MIIPPDQPKVVRLTTDYVDFDVGIAYRMGTILERQQSGQYALPGTRLGGVCVAGLTLLRDKYEVVE